MFFWQYDHKVHKLAVKLERSYLQFKQLSPGLADKYEVKKMHIHQVCIKHAVFITFTFRSSKKWEISYETTSLD